MMGSKNISKTIGAPWPKEKLRASVEIYHMMMDQHREGITFNKTEYYRELSEKYGRTPKTYGYRIQKFRTCLKMGKIRFQG